MAKFDDEFDASFKELEGVHNFAKKQQFEQQAINEQHQQKIADYTTRGIVDTAMRGFIFSGGNETRGNSVAGNSGWLGNQIPYLTITMPNLSIPENYGHYHGYPSNITSRLGDLSGYTQVSAIHLDNLNATQPEIEELDGILKGGIIING